MGAGPEPVAFRTRLLDWYRRERRDLPWRATRDPYNVWISEVMLQQTRVEAVAPRYDAFLKRFPTLQALALAGEEEVLAAWSGLGYYGRARRLHASAGRILRDHAGSFPRDRAEALRLPGVGAYIANAVLSIAYDLPLAVVDGNVVRVLSRVEMIAARSPSTLQKRADRLLDPRFPGDANQALMELGATICTPLAPRCGRCPLKGLCAARAAGRTADFPPAASRAQVESVETSIWIAVDRRSRIWIEKREIPPLRGMWMFPWREGPAHRDGAREVGALRHSIMNRRYRCSVWEIHGGPGRIPGRAAGEGRWVVRTEIAGLPHSSLLGKALALWDPGGEDGDRRIRSRRQPGAQPGP
jgi:A/G-specific adenine glycosylase